MNIEKIDPNFLKGSTITRENLHWYLGTEKPFSIHGLAVAEDMVFLRIPQDVAGRISEGIGELAWCTAGGRIRFGTDSRYIAVRVHSRFEGYMNHMPLTGSAGVDIFINGKSVTTFRPAVADGGWYEGECQNIHGMAEVELNLPLYNGVKCVLIGLEENATLTAPKPYCLEKPIVYYGSSITQGGCASKPGNAYQGFLSRWLQVDHINLGFSGNAKGELLMADYINSLAMSALVLDYDHNAPTNEHYENTHSAFYHRIREEHPQLPVLIVTRPDTDRDPEEAEKRIRIAKKTYQQGIEAGDCNLYFLDGHKLFGETERDACTMDGVHPNDLGFFRMATAMYPILKSALNL